MATSAGEKNDAFTPHHDTLLSPVLNLPDSHDSPPPQPLPDPLQRSPDNLVVPRNPLELLDVLVHAFVASLDGPDEAHDAPDDAVHGCGAGGVLPAAVDDGLEAGELGAGGGDLGRLGGEVLGVFCLDGGDGVAEGALGLGRPTERGGE